MPSQRQNSSGPSKRRRITLNRARSPDSAEEDIYRRLNGSRKRPPKTVGEYVYEPLTSETSIRILELLPGRKDDYIQCQLQITALDEAPQYEAMSYAWGSPSDKRVIICNGRKTRIPTNLRDALKRVRDPVKVKHFWADAICINQSDLKEVGHQVRQMASIYSTAERVIVWLGLGNPFVFFDEDEDLSTLIQRFFELSRSCANFEDYRPITAMSDASIETYAFFMALGELLHRPWFHRLWVVQEIGLAKSALALFGDDQEINFDDLIDFAQKFVLEQPAVAQYYGYLTMHEFTLFRETCMVTHSSSIDELDFLDVLEYTKDQLASDPRDFVFALLGHPSAQIGGGLIIEPDYQKSHWEIYHELAITLLQQSQDLRVLSAVRHIDEDSLTRAYPSWIPTWKRGSSPSIGTNPDVYQELEAHAGYRRSLQFTRASTMLQVQGFAFDTVDEYTNEFRQSERPKAVGISSVEEWPIAAAMALGAFSMMSTQEKLYELLMALTGGLLDTCLAKPDQKDFAAFRFNILKKTSDPKDAGPCGLFPEGLAAAEEAAKGGNAQTFLVESEAMVPGKRLFTTKSGLIGVGPTLLRSDDICCILFGGKVPFLLRRVGSAYRLVGDVYIRKVMQGEAVVDLELGDMYRTQIFDIF